MVNEIFPKQEAYGAHDKDAYDNSNNNMNATRF